MKIRWTVQAADDLESVHEYVRKNNPRSADDLIDRILADIDLLDRFPYLGRAGRIEGTRELVITRTPFVVAYRLIRDHVEILGVMHGARKWPARF